jgi:hypothetical protein
MDFEWVNEISVIYIGLQFKWYSSLVGGYAVDYTVDELTNYLEDTTIKEL